VARLASQPLALFSLKRVCWTPERYGSPKRQGPASIQHTLLQIAVGKFPAQNTFELNVLSGFLWRKNLLEETRKNTVL
jgi:hypothetical protein